MKNFCFMKVTVKETKRKAKDCEKISDKELRSRILNLLSYLFIYTFWQHSLACRVLVPWPGIEPSSWAVSTHSPNHWTTKEFP